MAIGDGKAKKEAAEIKEELGFILDAVSSIGDKLVASFEDAVDFKRSISKNKSLLSKYFWIIFIEFLESVKHGIPMAIQLL